MLYRLALESKPLDLEALESKPLDLEALESKPLDLEALESKPLVSTDFIGGYSHLTPFVVGTSLPIHNTEGVKRK